MRSFRDLSAKYFLWVLSPLLLLIKTIFVRGASLSHQFSHITQSNLAPTVDSKETDDVMSYLYVFQCFSNISINSTISQSDTNLSGKGFLAEH